MFVLDKNGKDFKKLISVTKKKNQYTSDCFKKERLSQSFCGQITVAPRGVIYHIQRDGVGSPLNDWF